jgi:YD repeat-containing protein
MGLRSLPRSQWDSVRLRRWQSYLPLVRGQTPNPLFLWRSPSCHHRAAELSMGCTKEADLSDLGACCAWEMHRSQHNQEHTGDPVNVVTGAFSLVESDFAVPCQRLPLVFTRAYDSQAHAFEPAGGLGPGWTHSFALRIKRKKGGGDVVYMDDRHTRLEFRCVDGTLRAPEGAQGMRLASTPTGWTLRQLDGLGADFDTDGRLTRLYRPGPRRDSVLTLFHADGRLERVEGATGALLFDWAEGRIVAISTPAGRWGYDYDAEGRLVAVTRPSGITQRYAYASDEHVVTVLDVDPKSDVRTPRRESREITGMRHVFAPTAPGERMVALVTNVYTSEYRVALQVDALGGETRFAYNQFTRMTAVTDPEHGADPHARRTRYRVRIRRAAQPPGDPYGRPSYRARPLRRRCLVRAGRRARLTGCGPAFGLPGVRSSRHRGGVR